METATLEGLGRRSDSSEDGHRTRLIASLGENKNSEAHPKLM